jgi:branched-chain amino acid transport system substrate-binding protein
MAAANQKLDSILGPYPTASGSTTRGFNGKSILLGCISADTDAGVPTIFNGFCEGVKARLDQANTYKELPWTLDLTSSDDTGTQQATQTLDITEDVDSDHDFGLYVVSGLGPIGTTLLESQHVPYFGNFLDCGTASIFGYDITNDIQGCTAMESQTNNKWQIYGDGVMTAYTHPTGKPFNQVTYAGIGTDQAEILEYVSALEGEYKAIGVKIVGNSTSMPANSTSILDLSPYVLPLVALKPDIIGVFSADPQLIARIISALHQAGYTGDISAACSADELQNPTTAAEINGCLATSDGWGFPGFGGPGWTLLNSEATALGQPTPVTEGFFEGWFTADLSVQGLKDFAKTGKPLTTENLVNFMNQGWVYPGFSDVIAPQTFPFGKYASQPCAAMAREEAATKTEVPYQDLICGSAFFGQL